MYYHLKEWRAMGIRRCRGSYVGEAVAEHEPRQRTVVEFGEIATQ